MKKSQLRQLIREVINENTNLPTETNNALKEIAYPFSEYDTTYDDEDNSLIDVEYTFKTEENTYKVVLSSKEKAREFEVSFGIDTGNFNK
jgi:hypothetical protein